MKDPLIQLLKPVGQFMRFLRFISIMVLILLFLLALRWIEVDLRINEEKIKEDLETTGRSVVLLLRPNRNTERAPYYR